LDSEFLSKNGIQEFGLKSAILRHKVQIRPTLGKDLKPIFGSLWGVPIQEPAWQIRGGNPPCVTELIGKLQENTARVEESRLRQSTKQVELAKKKK